MNNRHIIEYKTQQTTANKLFALALCACLSSCYIFIGMHGGGKIYFFTAIVFILLTAWTYFGRLNLSAAFKKKGMTITQTELTWREDKTITTIPWAEITDAHLERVKTSWIRQRTIKIALKITHQRKGESEPRHESFDLRGIGINNEEEFIKKNTELLGRNPFSETITKYWVLPF